MKKPTNLRHYQFEILSERKKRKERNRNCVIITSLISTAIATVLILNKQSDAIQDSEETNEEIANNSIDSLNSFELNFKSGSPNPERLIAFYTTAIGERIQNPNIRETENITEIKDFESRAIILFDSQNNHQTITLWNQEGVSTLTCHLKDNKIQNCFQL